MRDIIVHMDPTIWSEISVIFFGFGFVALMIWVCMPSRKSVYEHHSKLPLESE